MTTKILKVKEAAKQPKTNHSDTGMPRSVPKVSSGRPNLSKKFEKTLAISVLIAAQKVA